ncbi:MAG TPA: prolyl oligopeptidase family serine peptidase, partial [Micromonosporaceae bacterium]
APPVLLVGHSAGGHLALWSAAGRSRAGVSGVLALAPVSDLAEAYRLDLDSGAVAALLGGGPEAVPDRYAETDPGMNVPVPIPCVVVHGALDQQVPVSMSRRYVARARAAGGEARLVELADVEHFGLIDPEGPAWATVVDALRSLHP